MSTCIKGKGPSRKLCIILHVGLPPPFLNCSIVAFRFSVGAEDVSREIVDCCDKVTHWMQGSETARARKIDSSESAEKVRYTFILRLRGSTGHLNLAMLHVCFKPNMWGIIYRQCKESKKERKEKKRKKKEKCIAPFTMSYIHPSRFTSSPMQLRPKCLQVSSQTPYFP
jgi:hypothetical protein